MAFTVVEEGQDGQDEISVHNTNEKFQAEKFSNRADQKLFDGNHWANYFLCGYKSIMLHNEEITKLLKDKPKGLKILIDSSVPIAAGVSSSSAFTVCIAILTAQANGVREGIQRQLLAD